MGRCPTPRQGEGAFAPGEQRTERAGAKRQTFHATENRTPLRGDGWSTVQKENKLPNFHLGTKKAPEAPSFGRYGGLCWTRTSDPYRVKVVL